MKNVLKSLVIVLAIAAAASATTWAVFSDAKNNSGQKAALQNTGGFLSQAKNIIAEMWGKDQDKDRHDPKKDKIDLTIDSQCHYYQYDPQNAKAIVQGELTGYVDVGCFFDGKPFGTWTATDLGRQKFFQFADVKPGDRGEDTASLHVSGGDACGRILIKKTESFGNDCTEPETQTQDHDCKNKISGQNEPNGELWENLEFKIWLDQGQTPGFQGQSDPGEGDNLFNGNDQLVFDWTTLNKCPQAVVVREAFQKIRKKYQSQCSKYDPKGDGHSKGYCRGITLDGALTEGVTYYYGFAWRLPASVGNEVQTDSLKLNISFNAVPKEFCGKCDHHEDDDHGEHGKDEC